LAERLNAAANRPCLDALGLKIACSAQAKLGLLSEDFAGRRCSELYGLPRKFNIALDDGGRAAVLEDTNDIALSCRSASRRCRSGRPPIC
jgi:sulfite reductase beta subunit-like hemoprotein